VRQKLPFLFAAVMAAMVLPGGAGAQAVSLQEQLAAQYKLAQMGADSTGWRIVQEGTLLVVQKGGIVGAPYANMTSFPSIYENGTVHSFSPQIGHAYDVVNKVCKWFPNKCPTTPDPVRDETTTYLFKVGDKVYPTKIDVHLDKDIVAMDIVACDECNQTNPPSANRAQVWFQFATGSLAKASAGDVEDKIGQLLSIASDQDAHSGQQDQQSAQGGQDPGRPTMTHPPTPPPQTPPTLQDPPKPQPQSTELKKGMTPAQVEAALGAPDNKVNFENEQIYFYKNIRIKVIFLNSQVSQVSDVQ